MVVLPNVRRAASLLPGHGKFVWIKNGQLVILSKVPDTIVVEGVYEW
jgi:hypothetical protein